MQSTWNPVTTNSIQNKEMSLLHKNITGLTEGYMIMLHVDVFFTVKNPFGHVAYHVADTVPSKIPVHLLEKQSRDVRSLLASLIHYLLLFLHYRLTLQCG